MRPVYLGLVLTSALLTSCSGSAAREREQESADASAKGSCLHADPTKAGLELCYESDDSTAKPMCTATDGSWASKACDPKKYARRCQSVSQVSVNDGPEHDVHETNWFQEGSGMNCIGAETRASESAAQEKVTADDEELKRGDQTMSDAAIRKKLKALKRPKGEVDETILWGGVVKNGAVRAQTFDIPFRNVNGLELTQVAFATTKECMRYVALNLRYKLDGDELSGMDFATHYIAGGVVKMVEDQSGRTTTVQPAVSGTLAVSGVVDHETGGDGRVPSGECPFLASFVVREVVVD